MVEYRNNRREGVACWLCDCFCFCLMVLCLDVSVNV